jgi:hypothetical protein
LEPDTNLTWFLKKIKNYGLHDQQDMISNSVYKLASLFSYGMAHHQNRTDIPNFSNTNCSDLPQLCAADWRVYLDWAAHNDHNQAHHCCNAWQKDWLKLKSVKHKN